jgi:hypothetical protein
MKVRDSRVHFLEVDRAAKTCIPLFAPSIRKPATKPGIFACKLHRLKAACLTTASDVLFAGGRDGQFVASRCPQRKLLWQTLLRQVCRRGSNDVHGEWEAVRFPLRQQSTVFTFALPD